MSPETAPQGPGGEDAGSMQVPVSQGRFFAGLCVGQGDIRRDGECFFINPP